MRLVKDFVRDAPIYWDSSLDGPLSPFVYRALPITWLVSPKPSLKERPDDIDRLMLQPDLFFFFCQHHHHTNVNPPKADEEENPSRSSPPLLQDPDEDELHIRSLTTLLYLVGHKGSMRVTPPRGSKERFIDEVAYLFVSGMKAEAAALSLWQTQDGVKVDVSQHSPRLAFSSDSPEWSLAIELLQRAGCYD